MSAFNQACSCGKVYPITAEGLQTKIIYLNQEEAQPVVLVASFLVCPKCGKKQVVQIDSDYTKALLEKLKKLMICFKPSATRRSKMAKANSELDKERAYLNEQYLDKAIQSIEG